jgi:hypothetical protein
MKRSLARFAVLACALLSLVSGLSGCGSSSHPTSASKPEYAHSANLNQVTGFTVNLSNGALSAPSNVAARMTLVEWRLIAQTQERAHHVAR